MTRLVPLWAIVIVLGPWAFETGRAQERRVDAQVRQLVQQLDAERAADRERAERRLLELGPEILAKLPSPDTADLSAEQRLRLRRIIRTLRRRQAEQQLAGTRITLSGTFRLSELMKRLSELTGNDIVDRRAELGQPVADPELEISWEDRLFWEAFLDMCARAGLTPELYDSDRAIAVIAGQPVKPPRTVQGGLMISAERLTLTVDYTVDARIGTLDLLLAWEPKVRIVRVMLHPAELSIVDDTGHSMLAQGPPDATIQVSPELGQFAVSVTIPVRAPALGAAQIERVDGTVRLLVSAVTRAVRIGPLRQGLRTTERTTDLTLQLLNVLDEAGVWRIQARVEYTGPQQDDQSEPLTESYEDWFLQTEAYLVNRRSGERFELNGGYNLLATGDRSFAIEYLFVDAPGKISDYDLVLEIPSEPVWVPVPIRFRQLALPIQTP